MRKFSRKRLVFLATVFVMLSIIVVGLDYVLLSTEKKTDPNSPEENTIGTASFIIFHDNQVPKNYYAKSGGNGKIIFSGTDAATVIQNAINELGAVGGKIYIKAGKYIVTKTIKMGEFPTVFEGEGRGIWPSSQGTELFLADNANCDVIELNWTGGMRGFNILRNFYINGNWTNNTAGNGIRIINTRDILLEDIFIHRVKESGVLVYPTHEDGTWNLWFSRLCIELAGGSGIELTSYKPVYRWFIKDCYIGETWYGIRLWRTGVEGGEIIGNTIDRTGSYGLALSDVKNIVVVGNVIHDSSEDVPGFYDGIYITGASSDIIINSNRVYNRMTSAQRYGINIEDGNNILVIGNDVRGNGRAGIGIAIGKNPNGRVDLNLGTSETY